MLPQFNGVKFLDDTIRREVRLYTDASGIGVGGYFFEYIGQSLEEAITRLTPREVFATPTYNQYQMQDGELNINVYEVHAVLVAFEAWAEQWQHAKVVVFTDNTTAQAGLKKDTLRGIANVPLRRIKQLAAAFDIQIVAYWL